MSRALVTRIQKLEGRRTADEMLLIWRKLGQDKEAVVLTAKQAGLFRSGDRVISAEWLGDDKMPASRWVEVTPTGWLKLAEREKEYCDSAVMKIAGNRDDRPIDHDPALLDWTEADLMHFIFGVET